MSDTAIKLTTEQFWAMMCNHKFKRTSLHTGTLDDVEYSVTSAPEQHPHFVSDKTAILSGVVVQLVKELKNEREKPKPSLWERIFG